MLLIIVGHLNVQNLLWFNNYCSLGNNVWNCSLKRSPWVPREIVILWQPQGYYIWDGKESLKSTFNSMIRLGFVIVEDAILQSRKQLRVFQTFWSRRHLPHICGYQGVWYIVLNNLHKTVFVPLISSKLLPWIPAMEIDSAKVLYYHLVGTLE